jgi:hypothetical protein
MLIARSLPSAVIGPSPAAPEPSAKQLRWARHPPSNCAGHAHAKQLQWARKRASQPSGRTPAIDVARLIAGYPPARLPTQTTSSMTLQDTKPESLEIMLRLLIVALPLIVALRAAFDEQEVNALQFEVQSPLQFEVRSPPESRPLLPAATQDQHKSPATHSTPRAHHPSAPITIHAPRH